jgi:hypothetical protein
MIVFSGSRLTKMLDEEVDNCPLQRDCLGDVCYQHGYNLCIFLIQAHFGKIVL